MAKIKAVCEEKEIRIELLFEDRKDAIGYLSDFGNFNDLLELMVYDFKEEEPEEPTGEESEEIEMVEKMVSSVSTECLHDFMKVIVNELKNRESCSLKQS